MRDWSVLIVEDDPTVASVHRRLVASHPGFRVSAVASDAETAFAMLRRGLQVDLVLLDIALPGVNGSALLRALRAAGGPEVIAVTAVREPAVVREMLQLGVIDYLVKPFAAERLRQALVRFRDRMRALERAQLGQHEIDALAGRSERALLPRGLRPETLRSVRAALDGSGGDPLDAQQVGARAGVARVTAHRYLEYLAAQREVEVEAHAVAPGRPRKLYRRARADG